MNWSLDSKLDLQASSQVLGEVSLPDFVDISAEQCCSIAEEATPVHVHVVRDRPGMAGSSKGFPPEVQADPWEC